MNWVKACKYIKLFIKLVFIDFILYGIFIYIIDKFFFIFPFIQEKKICIFLQSVYIHTLFI